MNLRRIQEKEEVNHQNENYPAKTRVKDSDLPSTIALYDIPRCLYMLYRKVGRVFPMVIPSEFYLGK